MIQRLLARYLYFVHIDISATTSPDGYRMIPIGGGRVLSARSAICQWGLGSPPPSLPDSTHSKAGKCVYTLWVYTFARHPQGRPSKDTADAVSDGRWGFTANHGSYGLRYMLVVLMLLPQRVGLCSQWWTWLLFRSAPR